jgi:hypothetical protein
MKTVSEQLKEMGLQHGDMCEIDEIEGAKERYVVIGSFNGGLYARSALGLMYGTELLKVNCGWKKHTAYIGSGLVINSLHIEYIEVLPAPVAAPLPEAVESVLGTGVFDIRRMPELARAIIAECKK